MVARPYIEKQIRNYKTGKNKIRDKKEKRDKARRTMYLRHCCVGGKNMVGSTASLRPKRVRQANKPAERNPVMGQKDHFMETCYEKKNTHTHTPHRKEFFEHFLLSSSHTIYSSLLKAVSLDKNPVF